MRKQFRNTGALVEFIKRMTILLNELAYFVKHAQPTVEKPFISRMCKSTQTRERFFFIFSI